MNARTTIASGGTASLELTHEVTQFLYREMRLLDDERYEDWLALLTDDVHYWMPGVQSRYRADRAPRYDPNRMAHFDDNFAQMKQRVARYLQRTAWAEDPPTRHCHGISNVEVEHTDRADQYLVRSVFSNVRSRNEADEDRLAGRRCDWIRRVADGSLRIARREIYLVQTVLLTKNINTFL